MCAVAKCKSKKFSLFSTFAVAFSCSFFVAFLSLKTTNKFFDMTNYFPQKRTLWPGQSLSSPIRGRFFWPQMERFVDSNNFQQIFTCLVRVHAIAAKTWACFCTLLNLEVSWNWRFHEISMRYPTLPQEGVFMEALIWANAICNAKFDWMSLKETKSTYEKQPFSTREARFPHMSVSTNTPSSW